MIRHLKKKAFLMSLQLSGLPSEYTAKEFLRGSGDAYIDTGVYFNAENMSMEIEEQSTYIGQNCDAISSSGGLTTNYLRLYHNYNGGKVYFSLVNANTGSAVNIDTRITTNDLNRHKFLYQNKKLYVDDTLISTLTQSFAEAPNPLLLFGRVVSTGRYKGKIYYCKIWDSSGVLIRDYIPCVRNIDNKPGMYDLVNRTFNPGTGTFLVEDSINLWSDMPTTTNWGCTIEQNADGSYHLYGTATSTQFIVGVNVPITEAGDYTFRVEYDKYEPGIHPTVGYGRATMTQTDSSTNAVLYWSDTSNSVLVGSLVEGSVRMSINVRANQTYDVNLYPMLVKGRYTSSTMPQWVRY